MVTWATAAAAVRSLQRLVARERPRARARNGIERIRENVAVAWISGMSLARNAYKESVIELSSDRVF